MSRIIVPIDFSDLSRHAMNFAAEFAQLTGSEVTLIHVLEFPMSQFSFTGEANRFAMENFYTKAFIDSLEDQLEEWKQMLSASGTVVKSLMKYGNPYQKISGTITEENADFIIMGSKGASGLKQIFIGSNAERMVRYAHCPVIIIKGETHIEDFGSIVFATDGSLEQDTIASQIKHIQKLLGLELYLVKVKTHFGFEPSEDIETELQQFAERNDFSNFQTKQVIADYLFEGAIDFAEEIKAGIILIGTHGRTGLGHFFSGSKAEDLVNQSEIPVITLKLS